MAEYAAAEWRPAQKAKEPSGGIRLQSLGKKGFHAHEISLAKRLAKA